MNERVEITDESVADKTTRVLGELVERFGREAIDDGNSIYSLNVQLDGAFIVSVSGSAGVIVAGMVDALRFVLPRLYMQSQLRIELRDAGMREYPPTVQR